MLAKSLEGEIVARTRAMATEVTIKLATVRDKHEIQDSDAAIGAALEVFHTVEQQCTRFDPTSPLMRANASPTRWHRVPDVLYKALLEASSANQRTAGRFEIGRAHV